MNSATLFSVKYYVIDLFWCKKEIVICQKIICLKCICYSYKDRIYLNRRRRSQALWTLDRFDSNPPIAQFKIEVFMIRSLFGTQGQLMFQGFKWRLYLRILSINSEWHLSITSHKSFANASLLYLMSFDLDLMNNKILEFVFKATIFFLIRSGRKFHDEWACLTQLLFSSCL